MIAATTASRRQGSASLSMHCTTRTSGLCYVPLTCFIIHGALAQAVHFTNGDVQADSSVGSNGYRLPPCGPSSIPSRTQSTTPDGLQNGAHQRPADEKSSWKLHAVRGGAIDAASPSSITDIDTKLEALRNAAASNDLEQVHKLVLDDAPLAREAIKHGMLQWAVAVDGNTDAIVEALLKHSGSIPTATPSGATPLHAAALKGKVHAIALLLNANADVNAATASGITPLHSAAGAGQAEAVSVLTRRGASLSAVTKRGETPLHLAAATNGAASAVDVLLRAGAKVDALTAEDNATPLHLAVQLGDAGIESTEILLRADAPTEAVTSAGYTPLFFAANLGSARLAELLLSHGSDANAADSQGATPLYFAVRRGHEQVASLLLHSGAKLNVATDDGISPLMAASSAGQARCVRLLLDAGAIPMDTTKNGLTALHAAAESGSLDALRELLAHGMITDTSGSREPRKNVNVNAGGGQNALLKGNFHVDIPTSDGITPLMAAAAAGKAEAVAVLLAHGACVGANNSMGKTALHLAAASGDEGTVGVLLRYLQATREGTQEPMDIATDTSTDTAQRNPYEYSLEFVLEAASGDDGETALHVAAVHGHAHIARQLLAAGALTSAPLAISHESALHVAAMKGWPEVARALIEGGADLEQKSASEQTALHAAIIFGHEAVAELLLKHGARADSVWRRGASALHEASGKGLDRVISLLLQHGADVNATDEFDDTPLHWAAALNQTESTVVLIEAGANLEAKNRFGDMPLHHAAFSGSLETFCTLYSRAERRAVAAVDNRGSTPLSLLSRRALVLLSNAASTALALAEKSKVSGQKVPEYSQHIDQGAEVRQLNEYLTALIYRQKSMSSGLQHLMHALEAETERRSLEISLRDEGLGWGGDTATSGLPSLVGTDWAQAAADITSPLEYKLLVELANPETVNASELIVELARVKRSLTFERSVRSMLECQDRGAILRRRGVLSFEACNTLKRELDRRASLRAGTTDGMPEFTLHLNRAELQQLIGEDATTILWQLPSTYIAESAAHRQSSELSNAGEKAERRPQIGGDAFAQNGLSFTEIEIFLRKFSAKTRPWIKLHADVATVTVNVALGTEDGSSSGGLLGVFGGKVHTIPRAIGEATVHPSTLVHGVSRMLESADTRYTLIIFFKQNVSAQE